MRNYRLVVLLKGDLAKTEREKMLSDIQKWAGDLKNVEVDNLGEKKLAYSIRGEQKAEYIVMKFGADALLGDFNARLEMHDNILRHLIVRD